MAMALQMSVPSVLPRPDTYVPLRNEGNAGSTVMFPATAQGLLHLVANLTWLCSISTGAQPWIHLPFAALMQL